jgi:hypothetical protein
MNPPKLAIALLKRLAPGRDDLAGDLVEQFRSGKSNVWLWRQVLGTILATTWLNWRTDRLGALKAVALGWAAMLAFFFVAGDVLAHSADQTVPRLLSYLGANRAGALWLESLRYVPPTVIGCVLSGWIVGRPVLFYAASVFLALLAGVTAIAWYAAPVAVPHTLFYVIILALPYWWWSGLLIVPLLIMIGGLWRVASTHPLAGKLA